ATTPRSRSHSYRDRDRGSSIAARRRRIIRTMSTRAAARSSASIPAAAARSVSAVLSSRLDSALRTADEGHWVLVYGLVGVVVALLFAALAYSRVDDARRGVEAIGEAITSIGAADQAASLLSGMDAHSIDNALAGPGG